MFHKEGNFDKISNDIKEVISTIDTKFTFKEYIQNVLPVIAPVASVKPKNTT